MSLELVRVLGENYPARLAVIPVAIFLGLCVAIVCVRCVAKAATRPFQIQTAAMAIVLLMTAGLSIVATLGISAALLVGFGSW